MLTLPILGGFDGGILAQAALFYAAAFAMLSVLGAGVALMLPKRLSGFGWAFAPYLGCSLLVSIGSLVVAAGGTIQETLLISSIVSAVVLAVQMKRRPVPTPAAALPVLLLSAASYAVTTLAMARQGTLGYVGPLFDPYWLIRYSEWLKYHPAPLFSSTWYSSIPPLDGWSDPAAKLQATIGDINLVLERGVRYWEATIGIVLGWDSALVFRPAQAFMLSLAGPATYLFTRTLLGASRRVALAAGVLIALNSTNLFWASLGHPGQTFWIALMPVALVLTLVFLEDGPLLPAALSISALLASYYVALLFALALAGPAMLWRLAGAANVRWSLRRIAILGLAVLLLALPVHIYAALAEIHGWLYRAVGWGKPGFSLPGEALGAMPPPGGVALAGGPDGLTSLGLALPPEAIMAATALGLGLAVRGLLLASGKTNPLRPLMLGLALVLAALFVANYPYGYVKAQSLAAFLVVSAAATGAAGFSGRYKPVAPFAAAAFAVVIGVAGANMAAVESAFWVPLGNVWKTTAWDGAELATVLPPNSTVRLSPFLQADGETITMAGYFLRKQKVVGAYGLQGWGGLHLLPESKAARHAEPEFEVLDRREIPAFRGFLPGDLVWHGSLATAYRHPKTGRVPILLQGRDSGFAPLPAELPVTVSAGALSGTAGGSLLTTFSVQQGTAEVLASWNGRQRLLTLDPGLAVRSLPAAPKGTALTLKSGRAVLLAVSYRPEPPDQSLAQDYPRSIAAVAFSSLRKQLVTRVAYFDAAIKGGASLDVSLSTRSNNVGWFHLPTLEDGYLRQMEVDLDPQTLSQRIISNGEEAREPFASPAKDGQSLPDGEYVAYLTVSADPSLVLPRRMPLYRYRLEGGTVTDFEQFPLSLAWTDLPGNW